MSDTSLLSSVRSSFLPSAPTTTSATSYDADTVVSPAAPLVPTTPPLTTDDQLQIISSVLDELEAKQVATTPTEAPVVVPAEPPAIVGAEAPAEATVQASEIEIGALAQAVPQATLQSTDTLNPQTPVGTSAKESQAQSALQEMAAESGISLQYVEQEKSPELAPEVESFLQKVEEHHEQAPQEIVIAGPTAQAPSTTHHPSQPVIVLPITPELEKSGKHAGIHTSVRWLVEWSHRIIKLFSGKVIYRQV